MCQRHPPATFAGLCCPQTWLSHPVSHSNCCSPWGQECWCQQGKTACLAPFWPAVPVSWADSILTCRSAWLQLACFGTRLSLTYFFSVCGPAWLLSFTAAPHSCLSICMVTHLTPWHNTFQFVIVMSSFPLWKDHCNLTCFLWCLAAIPRERSRERRVKRASLTARADIFAFSIQFSFPPANTGTSQKNFFLCQLEYIKKSFNAASKFGQSCFDLVMSLTNTCQSI